MTYYVMKITTATETGTHSKAVYEYSELKAAEAGFHSTYSSCLNNNSVNHAVCMLINDNGGVIENASWTDGE